MQQPRSRTRCRDPPSGGGGRHRRPSPSPRHQRRPPPPLRRSPDRRRHEDIPVPIPDRRARADILLEAGRLAAHYLVAQGVIPDHLLRAREDPNLAPVSRLEAPTPPPPPPAPASYGRKRDDSVEEDPRWRRAGDWGRAKGDSRRSGWDSRRSHSFDERRKHDVDRGARRTRDYDELKRPPLPRSYSQNDRRDPKRRSRSRRSRSRSRSRSRTRTRSYHHGGGRRDSDGRPTNRDLDHTKLPDPDSAAMNPAGGETPMKPKVPSAVVAAEVSDRPMAVEDGEMESEFVGLGHAQDVSAEEDGEFSEDLSQEEGGGQFAEDEEDGEFAADGVDDEDGADMDVTEPQPYDVDVRSSESVEEPVHMQSQLTNVEEQMEAGAAPVDASILQLSSTDKDGCFEVRDEMEAPRSEVEAAAANLDRDEQDLPSWYGIFDLNVVGTPEGCEMPEISGDSPADHVCISMPDLAGQMNEIQGQDEHAGANNLLECGHDLSKYDLNNVTDEHAHGDTSNIQGQDEDAGGDGLFVDEHDLNKYDLNHEADAQAQDHHLLRNEHDSDNFCLSNEQILPNQNADEQDLDDLQMESDRMLVDDQGTSQQGLDTYHVSDEQFMQSHVTDEQVVNKHQLEPELLHLPMGVHDVDSYNLNSAQMLLNNVTNEHAEEDTHHLKDRETLFNQAVDGQARVHNMGNERSVAVIDLEDDYEEQPDTIDTGDFLESISDQETSSFSDNPHTNKREVSSSITPNYGNRCNGRGAANSQAIPGDDDALYVVFDKMPLEVINVWDLASSELGKSS